MLKHWVGPGALAEKLARGEISNREVAHFLLANLLLSIAVYYSGLVWGNPTWTFLSLWEAALMVVVTAFGVAHCFEAAGGEANPRFMIEFTCLSFPIGLWTTIIVWSAAWAIGLGFRAWGSGLVPPDSAFSPVFLHLSGKFGWFMTMLAVVGSQVVFFVWMKRALRSVRAASSRS